jgi:hypothetical protein
MVRVAGSMAIALLITAVSSLSAQAPPPGSGNITPNVTVPGSIERSASFTSSLTLTGFDVQDPGVAATVLVLDESGHQRRRPRRYRDVLDELAHGVAR